MVYNKIFASDKHEFQNQLASGLLSGGSLNLLKNIKNMKNMKNSIKRTLAILATAAFTFQAHAILVDNGTYTTDTASDLDWLDMSYTDGLSYNAVASSIASGSLSGWRFATSAEFDGLINSAVGSPYTAVGADPAILSQMQNLISLLGDTYGGGGTGSFAFAVALGYVDSSSLSFADARQFGYSIAYGGSVLPESETYGDSDKTDIDSDIGSFLVRASTAQDVPDSGSSVLLLGMALAGIAYLKRR